MGSRRTSILVLAIVLVVCLIVLVGRIRDFYDQPDVFVVGGIYSIPGAQGGEAHMKILEADEDNVHLRLYTGPAPDDDAAD
ncbi:hypothetical protein K8I61_02510, partial [bacterium]|nr:hypothetical protein [bacterium]